MTPKQPSPDMGQSMSDEMVEAARNIVFPAGIPQGQKDYFDKTIRAALLAAERFRAPVGGDITDEDIRAIAGPMMNGNSFNNMEAAVKLGRQIAAMARVREQNSVSTGLHYQPFTEGGGAAKVAPVPVLAGDGKSDREILAEELEREGLSVCAQDIRHGDIFFDSRDRAALAAMARVRSAIPDGWRLVPVEPTPEMVRAGMDADDLRNGFETCKHIYRAIISAAPTLPIAKVETP